SFKVRDKIFAMQHRMGAASGHQDGRPSLWVKGLPGAQEILVGSDPARFFRPPYVGHHGWVGAYIDLDDVDWEHLRELVEESYRITAPKRLVKQLDGAG